MKNFQKAIFAAGCFWGVEESFYKTAGVVKTRVGYTGGQLANPNYEDVLSHKTGHAEAVEVTFDPKKISYEKLLDIFWAIHDPTQLNHQGPDIGNNYRSAIFYLNNNQKRAAQESKKNLEKSGKYTQKIVTEITKDGDFWEAENYHQKYFLKHSGKTCPSGGVKKSLINPA